MIVVSLRDLESRKIEIEQELQRVQKELEQRKLNEIQQYSEKPFAQHGTNTRVAIRGTSTITSPNHNQMRTTTSARSRTNQFR